MLIDAQGIHLFALILHWYAIFVVIGAWLGVEVSSRLAKRVGQEPEKAWIGLIWVASWGLIGARVWFVLFPPTAYIDNGLTSSWMLSHFFDLYQGAIAVWAGGLGLLGALIGGGLGLYIFTRRNRLPVVIWFDLSVIGLALAQAIGYFANSSAVYGLPTTLPWGILIDNPDLRVAPYTDLSRYPLATTHFQPIALYEMVLALFIFVILLILFIRFRYRFQPGDFTLIYGILYGIGRFLLELIRVNVSYVGEINISQLVAGSMALIALGFLGRRLRTADRPRYPHTIDLPKN